MHKFRAALQLAILLAVLSSSLLYAGDGLITTIAGDGQGGSMAGNIPATAAQLFLPDGIAVDASNNLFIADSGNNRVVRIDAASGILTVVAGNGVAASGGDGGPATSASLNGPSGVALDAAGDLFISEGANFLTESGNRIRCVNAQTGVITTIAGTSTAGYSGDGGPATGAALNGPAGLALDSAGNLYFADSGNYRVRRIDATTQTITTVAGNGINAYTPDGQLAAGNSLAQPVWVAVDSSGGLLVSELGSYRIRRIDPVSGLLSTVAGNGNANFTGDGVPATDAGIGFPSGMTVDPNGDLFFADGTGRIRRVDATTGSITTVAGNGTGTHGQIAFIPGSGSGPSYWCMSTYGDSGPATSALVESPTGVQLASDGSLLFSDFFGCRVRRVDLPSPLPYTNTVLTTSATTLQPGQQVLLTATVSPIGGNGAPTGTIQFVEKYPAIGPTATLNGGTASIVLTPNQAGGVMAVYSGDTSFNGSGSSEIVMTYSSAAKIVATVALTASQNPSSPGTTAVFTATVTPPTGTTTAPTGPVLLYDGSTLVAVASLVNGVATLPDTFTAAGNHSMTATYLGDNNYSQVSSAALTETVGGSAPVSVSLISSAPNSVYGQSVQLTISVVPASATGTIQLTVDGSVIPGSATLTNGIAVAFIPQTFGAGTHTITAAYSGDANHQPATSAPLTQNIAQATPTFTVTSSLNPSAVGQAVTLTVTMTPASTGTALGLQISNPPGNLTAVWSSGPTSLTTSSTTSALSAGTHAVTGVWGGDANVAAGTSAALTQTVQSTAVQTTTTLTTSPNPSVLGAPVTLTATVSPATATGQVGFAGNGNYPLGVANLVNGQAQVTITTLPVGSNTLKAGYFGDANDAISISPVVTQIVTSTTTTPSSVMLTSSANPSVAGQAVSLHATVSPATATGTVQFLDGATALGIVTVTGGSATLSISTLSVGTHSVTAAYSGDANDAASTSAALTQSVSIPSSSVTLTASQNPSTYGQFVTFFATVAPSAATGTVQFLDGSTAIGAVAITGGSAALSLSNLSIGTHSITAVYSGDGGFPTSTSAVWIQTISPVTASVQPQGIVTTLYGSTAGCAPGVTNCTISSPVVDGAGNIYFEDGFQILAISPTGVVSTIAGNGQQGTSGDGSSALSASIGFAAQIAVHGSRVCFADYLARKIRCVDLGTGLIEGYGTGLQQSSGDGGNVSNASFNFLAGIAFDDSGNLYVSDYIANEVRRVDAVTGTITALASINSPRNLYYYNGGVYAVATGTHEVQRIDLATGVISGVVGAGWNGYDYLALDQSGDVFFSVAQEIEMMDTSGNVTSIANTGGWDGYGAANDIPATEAVFISLDGLGWDPVAKRLLIADGSSLSQIFFTPPTATTLSVSANSVAAGAQVTLQAAVSPATATGSIRFYTGPPAYNWVPIGSVALSNGTASITWTVPTGGTSAYYEMRAVYGGDANDNLSASDPTIVGVQTAGAAATTTSLVASPNPSVYGGPVTLTAVVSPAAATGSVQFYDGSFLLGSATLAGGQAQFVPTSLEPGLLQLRAVYQGSSAYVASGSAVVTQTVAKAPSSVSLTSSPNPGVRGQNIYFGATVSSSSATGLIQLFDGPTLLGTSALTSGSALFGLSTLALGAHSITAVYSGDASRLASNSAVLTEIVSKPAPSVTLASSMSPSSAGQGVTFTARLWPTAATGTVQFLDGATSLGTASVGSGLAALVVSTLSAGSHSITAVYSGDTNYATSTSTALTQTVNQGASSVTLASSLNPSPAGQNVTLTAVVSPASATGTIQFLDGAMSLGSANVSGGSAALMVSTLSAGSHSITVVYSGDASYTTSTSAPLTQTVTRVSVTITLTSLTNPAIARQPITLAVNVTPSTATGTVHFGEYSPGTGSVDWGTVPLTNGSASLAIPSLWAGTYGFMASYSGDGSVQSGSSSLNLVVIQASSSVTLSSSSNPATPGQPVTFTAVVSPAAAAGTVQFLDSATALGTATIAGGSAVLSLSTLSVGAHLITAVYGGDINDAGSASAVLSQTVNKSVSGVAVASSLNPSTLGQAVTLSATVTPSTATGGVQFLDGSTVLGTVAVSGGAATLSLSSLAVGPHSITAVYSGDANDTTSTSAVLTQTVNKLASNVALTSSANPSTYGQAGGFTATVSPSTATGTVQLLDGSTVLGTMTISGGVATLSFSALSAGAHSITAVYSGDANDATSTSAVLAQTVNKIASTAALTSSANPSTSGQAVTFTAIVSPSSATGTVQFLDGATVLGTVTTSSGSAALSITTLSAGAHSITAVYSGDNNDAASAPAVLSQTVNKVASSMVLTSSLNPSAYGQPVTLAAVVSPLSATGSVQFVEGAGQVLGTVNLASGSASLSIAAFPVGANSISAVYSGDASNAASTSMPMTQTVYKAGTSVALGSSANPSASGQAVTFTAIVSPYWVTGTVQFLDGSRALGTVTISSDVAVLSLSSLSAGAHSITAVYSGDANDATSTSAVLTQTVNKVTSTVTLASSPNPSTIGQSVTFTATVSPSAATGTVQFLWGSTTLGTVTLAGGSAALSVSSLSLGANSITAVYSGNANYATSTSSTLTQTVNKIPTSVALTASPNPATVGQTVTFTAVLSPNTATGLVQFFEGSGLLGTVTATGGSASLTLTPQTYAFLAGTHSINAVYQSDATHAIGQSPVLTLTVNKAATTVALVPSANPSIFGHSVTFTATVAPSAATGTVQFLDGSTVLGTVAVTGGSAALSLSNLSAGAHSIKATYGGDNNYLASSSAVLSETVTTVTACHVTYGVTSQWNVGFGTALTIKNTGTMAVSGWNLTWTWAGDQQITQSWDAAYSQTGANAKLTNESYNAAMAPGATLTGIGFNASYSGTNTAPTAFYLNGTLCK